MSRIISSRGKAIREKAEEQRRLEEKFQLEEAGLSAEEQEHIQQVFERIRRDLDAIGRAVDRA